MRMYLIFAVLLALLAVLTVQAQTFPIKGKIIDKRTKENIAYASIRVKDKNVGVVSNMEGEFELFIPNNYSKDTLLISSLGYTNYMQALPTLKTGSELVVNMEPVLYALSEIVVKADEELSAEKIVSLAKKRISDNYPVSSYTLDGYFKKYQKVNDKYVYFYDAAVSIYDKGYQNAPLGKTDLQEKVVLKQTRLSNYSNGKGFENFADLEGRHFNWLRGLLIQNAVKYRSKALNGKHYAYETDSVVMYDGRAVYVVSANLRDRKYSPYCSSHNTEKVSFKLYIDVDDYSIYKIEYQPVSMDISNIKNVQNIVTNSKGPVKTYCEGGKGKSVIEFKKYNDKLYPHYMTHLNYVVDYDTVTHKTYVNQHVLELVITQVETESKQEPSKRSVMHPWKSLESQVTKYDAAFWNSYNMIKLSSIDKQLILDLEKELTLEEQFQKRTFAEIERNKINAFRVENNK